MPEYQELLEEFTEEELVFAYQAIMNNILQEELYERESPLLVFLFDTHKQDLLYEFIEDLEKRKESE
jgi:uncharacterized protein YccT (UPF0319 family)